MLNAWTNDVCSLKLYCLLKMYNSVFFNMAKFSMYRSAALISAAYELVELERARLVS